MPLSKETRYAGVEDEFRVAGVDGRPISIDDLVSKSERFFFDESGHVSVFEPVYDPDSAGGRAWTWYGGTLYHDYDSKGPLVEATTPLTPLNRGVEALVGNVLTQRAQLVELCEGHNILVVSTHLNLLLDSTFEGDDLCLFTARIPSNAFESVEAQKLGADIALIATHTISPIIAYLLFSPGLKRRAIYRPRKHRRMELCLPYVPDPDQMRAGFLFWFAAVNHITGLIKADLREHRDYADRYQSQDYYKLILAKFPFVIQGIKFKRPSYYLGYEIGSGQEVNVAENGSKAVISTDKGDINIVDLAKAYVQLFSEETSRIATKRQIALLEDFLDRKRVLNVDMSAAPESLRPDHSYIEKATGSTVQCYLEGHQVDELASVHLKFIRSPCRVISLFSPSSPKRILRNLATELDWDFVSLEIVEEDERLVRRHLLEVPLHQVDDYLRVEERCSSPYVFLSEIKKWTKVTTEISNPRSLFAHGTLMDPDRDRLNFGVIVTSATRGQAYGEAYDFGEYPVLIENQRASLVPGMLLSFLSFEEAASKFDAYEGCNDANPVYIRALREVLLPGFEKTTGWVYVGNRNNTLVKAKLKAARRLSGVWSKASQKI